MLSKYPPIISVILPVFNGEDHLAECIESILHQTYTNFEFIIVDDASTDNTPKILKKYSRQDERIKIITNLVNQKQTISANIACKNAVGKYLARMDADDIALPIRFEKQFAFLETNPITGIVGSWTDIISDNGQILGQWKTSAKHEVLIWDLLFGASFAHSSVMIRKDSIEQVGFYQLSQAEDYDLWSRISRIASIANIPEVLQQKRVWDGQLAHRVVLKNQECHLQIMKNNMQELLSESEIDSDLVKVIYSAIEKNQSEVESYRLAKAISLINKLYDTCNSKTDLLREERNKLKIDLFQLLNQFATWQRSSNIFLSIAQKMSLAFRFPKLFIYSAIQNIKNN